ncbi:MAG: GNAT family N-acetyltransferase [Burkholderiaceae bacterium]
MPSTANMNIVDCSLERHGLTALEIINEAIRSTTAIYDYQPRTMESMEKWFAAKESGGFPVLGLEDEAHKLVGFATYGPFRAFPAYRYTVETSVYIHHQHCRKGYGRLLMQELISTARKQDQHTLVACIDMQNTASIRLHENLGFTCSGVVREAGYKFGRWLDAGFYQLVLDTPAHPTEG